MLAGILFARRRAAHLTASGGIANAAVLLHRGVRALRLVADVTNVAFKIWPLEPQLATVANKVAIHGDRRAPQLAHSAPDKRAWRRNATISGRHVQVHSKLRREEPDT